METGTLRCGSGPSGHPSVRYSPEPTFQRANNFDSAAVAAAAVVVAGVFVVGALVLVAAVVACEAIAATVVDDPGRAVEAAPVASRPSHHTSCSPRQESKAQWQRSMPKCLDNTPEGSLSP